MVRHPTPEGGDGQPPSVPPQGCFVLGGGTQRRALPQGACAADSGSLTRPAILEHGIVDRPRQSARRSRRGSRAFRRRPAAAPGVLATPTVAVPVSGHAPNSSLGTHRRIPQPWRSGGLRRGVRNGQRETPPTSKALPDSQRTDALPHGGRGSEDAHRDEPHGVVDQDGKALTQPTGRGRHADWVGRLLRHRYSRYKKRRGPPGMESHASLCGG